LRDFISRKPIGSRLKKLEPPAGRERVGGKKIQKGIGLTRMGNPQWRMVGDACLVMHAVDRLVKKDHRELSTRQCRVELDAASFEIGLAEKPQAGRCFDGKRSNRPGRRADDEPNWHPLATAHMGVDGPQQRPGQTRIATCELRKPAGQRMRQMLLGAFMQQHCLRIMDQANQRMNECTPPMSGCEASTQQHSPVGEINIGMTPSHWHLDGFELADLKRVGTKLESLGECELAKLGGHDDVMRHQRRSPGLASSSPDMHGLSMTVCLPEDLSHWCKPDRGL